MSMSNQSSETSMFDDGDHTAPTVHDVLVSGSRSRLPVRLRITPSSP